MAITNHERVGKALAILKVGLGVFFEREMKSKYGSNWEKQAKTYLAEPHPGQKQDVAPDVALILVVMDRAWKDVFGKTLGKTERSIVNELKEVRNRWAHQESFTSDDTYRALDSAYRLLTAVSAKEALEVQKLKTDLLRLNFAEQARFEQRKVAPAVQNVESKAVSTGVKPWKEVVTPHKDVMNGTFQQAEFAADLWQVFNGEGLPEYLDPVEFFKRTYLTSGLRTLLEDSIKRICKNVGDPVVQLQTNFGGGKTHSMLALFHLFSGTSPSKLLGIEDLLGRLGVKNLPEVNRVVIVGNKISPGNPSEKEDGTKVNTLWGEIVWQLGFSKGGVKEAKKAYARVKNDDEKGTNPGKVLEEILNDYGPCLILIDEWIAYARQLHDKADLPGGSFETHFTFAQNLTEAVKAAKNCLLVVSLPVSTNSSEKNSETEDVETGGLRGHEALMKLQNVISRVASSWKPATSDESFEIVRRRLFEPIENNSQFVDRDSTIKMFTYLYKTEEKDFPLPCRELGYEKRMKAAYPIHPELFDRLYEDWSSLATFQRTRGVLRLMASVIHVLWERGDANPLIMPANIPIDDSRVQSELTRILPDNWAPIIDKDIDGQNSTPLKTDISNPIYNNKHACVKVARSIYIGSAPNTLTTNRGIGIKSINLASVMPGEDPSLFGDALKSLVESSTYLNNDEARFWYSTQQTINKLAYDRAEQFKGQKDAIYKELSNTIKDISRNKGAFSQVNIFPQASQDVIDDTSCKMVVLGIDHPYSKTSEATAESFAFDVLKNRGNSPRIYQNTIVFTAVEQSDLQELEKAIRKSLAWQSILNEKDTQNLTQLQIKTCNDQISSSKKNVEARINEAFKWLLVPFQEKPSAGIEFKKLKLLTTNDSFVMQASKILEKEDLMITKLGSIRLRMELDKYPLWNNHVELDKLAEYFPKFVYLPRLQKTSVLLDSISDGVSLQSWERDTFAYAEMFDEKTNNYQGLRTSERININENKMNGLLVKPEIAKNQLEKDKIVTTEKQTKEQTTQSKSTSQKKSFHGNATLHPHRITNEAEKITEEIINHFLKIPNSTIKVTIEIHAEVPDGIKDDVERTVSENCKTLGIDPIFEND